MNNRVLNKNPFGAISEDDIHEFQVNAGVRLPSEYQDYLIKYNGGNFERCIYDELSVPYQDVVVHQMYGIHEGPRFARLQDNYKLYCHFDLEAYKGGLKHYFVFANTATGDLLMLDLRTFSVHLFQHSFLGDNPKDEIDSVIVKLANSFDSFISVLLSQEQFDQKYTGSTMHNDFQKRLNALKLDRKQEVLRLLSKEDK